MNGIRTASLSIDDGQSVIPLVKNARHLEALRNHMGSGGPIADRLADDLWVVYVIDIGAGFRFLKDQDLECISLIRENLPTHAIANLKRIINPIIQNPRGPVFSMSASDLGCSCILIEELCNLMQERIKGDLVVGIPSRDCTIFTGTGNPGGLRGITDTLIQMYSRARYEISNELLCRNGGKWIPFQA